MSPLKFSHVACPLSETPHVMSFIFLLMSLRSILHANVTGKQHGTVVNHPPYKQKDGV